MSEHEWFYPPHVKMLQNIQCCKKCGIIRRKDGKNSPCRGKVRVEMRKERSK